MTVPRIVLASVSPRRAALLRALGYDPEIRAPAVPEGADDGERPEATVRRLAAAKARVVAAGVRAVGPTVVIGADTEVVLAGEVLGKPHDAEDAARILHALSGREHRVLTALHAARVDEPGEAADLACTRVWFRDLDPATIAWYVATGEPMDKAGAYGIQERGALLVDRILGSWSNVVGLPLERLPALLAAVRLPGLPPPFSP